MGKIDYQKAKKLSLILSGKAKPESRHAKKLKEVQMQMTAKNVIKDLNIAREIIKSMGPKTGLESDIYLFAYKSKFHLIEGGEYQSISEAEVRTQLDEHPDTQSYYLCTNEGMCPLPSVLSGKDAKGVQLKNDAGVIAYIKEISGVELKESDL